MLRYDRLIPLRAMAPDSDDLWGKLNGFGVALSIDPDEENAGKQYKGYWLSLNAAQIIALKPADGSDDEGGAVNVDPVALSPNEIGSVRQAMALFDNRSVVTQMPGDASADPSNLTSSNLDFFRTSTYSENGGKIKWRMPHLSFGSRIALTNYMIGVGDILPLALRGDAHPATLDFLKGTDERPGTDQ